MVVEMAGWYSVTTRRTFDNSQRLATSIYPRDRSRTGRHLGKSQRPGIFTVGARRNDNHLIGAFVLAPLIIATMTQVDYGPRTKPRSEKFRPNRPERCRTFGVPSMRCTATAKGTGDRCSKWAVVGTTVCHTHGVTGATMRKADERLTMAQLFDRDPRHPWQVVLDMTHKLDVITQEFQADVLAGENVTADQLDGLIELARTTHHLATTAISTKAAENVAMAFTQHLDMQGRMVATAIAAGLDKLGLTDPWRAYALEVAHWALLGESGEAQGDEPRPPTDPVVMEYDVRPHNAPAIEAAPKPCDVTTLDDQALRSLGEQVLAELERRDLSG